MGSVMFRNLCIPANCLECEWRDAEACGECEIMIGNPFQTFEEQYEHCPFRVIAKRHPLVPVTPHGDLIDRDALRASIRESIEECHKWADEVDKDTMMYARISQSLGTFVECSLRAKAAPTIIPAEEGE